MEQLIIIPEHTTPQETLSKNVDSFIVNPKDKTVKILVVDNTIPPLERTPINYQTIVTIKFADISNELTLSQKNIIKGFFKQLAAYALDASVNDISGDIMD